MSSRSCPKVRGEALRDSSDSRRVPGRDVRRIQAGPRSRTAMSRTLGALTRYPTRAVARRRARHTTPRRAAPRRAAPVASSSWATRPVVRPGVPPLATRIPLSRPGAEAWSLGSAWCRVRDAAGVLGRPGQRTDFLSSTTGRDAIEVPTGYLAVPLLALSTISSSQDGFEVEPGRTTSIASRGLMAERKSATTSRRNARGHDREEIGHNLAAQRPVHDRDEVGHNLAAQRPGS